METILKKLKELEELDTSCNRSSLETVNSCFVQKEHQRIAIDDNETPILMEIFIKSGQY